MYKVIDISQHNDLNVKLLNVDAVILRVGYRGYGTSGKIVLDSKFKEYAKALNKAKIPIGVYFYSQATTSAEAKAEATFVLDKVKAFNIDLPIYYDVEYAEKGDKFIGRLYDAKLGKDKLTKLCKAFCDKIISNGYKAGVYANYDFFKNKLIATDLTKYSLWIAHYSTKNVPVIKGVNFDLWQYTDDGKVNGVTGEVDCDKMVKDMIWCAYKTTTSLNYRSNTDLKYSSLKGCMKANTLVYVYTGSEYYANGFTWVKIKFNKDDENYFWVAKQYLKAE